MFRGRPTYPETSDMGYAMWLRHFAAHLPAYAFRYELTETELADAKSSAAAFIAWLTRRIDCATQAIQQRYTAAYSHQQDEDDVSDARLLLLQPVVRLVRAIRTHRHYRMADGIDLGLSGVPNTQGFDTLPAPHLSLVGHYQALDEKVAVALCWASHPEAVVDLQVCRDGLIWQPLELVAGESYADIHRLPVELTPWQYRARYRRPDWPAGCWGKIITVDLTEVLPALSSSLGARTYAAA